MPFANVMGVAHNLEKSMLHYTLDCTKERCHDCTSNKKKEKDKMP